MQQRIQKISTFPPPIFPQVPGCNSQLKTHIHWHHRHLWVQKILGTSTPQQKHVKDPNRVWRIESQQSFGKPRHGEGILCANSVEIQHIKEMHSTWWQGYWWVAKTSVFFLREKLGNCVFFFFLGGGGREKLSLFRVLVEHAFLAAIPAEAKKKMQVQQCNVLRARDVNY